MRSLLVFAGLVVLTFGCGSLIPLPSQDGRCDLRPAKPQCTDIRDFKGPTLVTFEALCGTLTAAIDGGTYTAGARCDSAAALGGCQTANADGSKQTNWYYQGTKYADVAAAQAECANAMSFVTE
jgi:hypothetical protein